MSLAGLRFSSETTFSMLGTSRTDVGQFTSPQFFALGTTGLIVIDTHDSLSPTKTFAVAGSLVGTLTEPVTSVLP